MVLRSLMFLRCVGPSLQGLEGSSVRGASSDFTTVVLDTLTVQGLVIILALLVPSQLLC